MQLLDIIWSTLQAGVCWVGYFLPCG